MARIPSKTNWTASDRPLAPDFNRIESNNEQAFNEIDAEESARIAAISAETSARIAGDSALNSAISAETSARISADNTKLNHSTINRTFSTLTVSNEGTTTIPAGTYYIECTSPSGSGELQVRDATGTWRGIFGVFAGISQEAFRQTVISDGTNLRVSSIAGVCNISLVRIG